MITVVPSGKDQFELPMQNLAGIYGFMLYYKKTGDRELIETAFPMSISYLKLFGMRNGLVEHRTGSWDWPDWGDNFDVPVMENAWYYMALRSTKEMAELLGRSEEAVFCAERMNQIDSSFDIHIRYADMVNAEYSTLWEYWNTDGTKKHAWSGGPLIVLSRYCKGITN